MGELTGDDAAVVGGTRSCAVRRRASSNRWTRSRCRPICSAAATRQPPRALGQQPELVLARGAHHSEHPRVRQIRHRTHEHSTRLAPPQHPGTDVLGSPSRWFQVVSVHPTIDHAEPREDARTRSTGRSRPPGNHRPRGTRPDQGPLPGRLHGPGRLPPAHRREQPKRSQEPLTLSASNPAVMAGLTSAEKQTVHWHRLDKITWTRCTGLLRRTQREGQPPPRPAPADGVLAAHVWATAEYALSFLLETHPQFGFVVGDARLPSTTTRCRGRYRRISANPARVRRQSWNSSW